MTSTPGSAVPTAATTPRPPEQAVREGRFSPAERWAHGATAALMLLCIASAACLYIPALAQLVGRRALVVTVHEWTGLLLPVPLLAALASRALRADLRRLDRFGPHDRHWLRAALRRERRPRPQGKFNAGQKLYAAWIAGAVLVMLGTGLLMWFTGLAPLAVRTGATFVHDWLALAVAIVVAGHIGMALSMWSQRSAMRQYPEMRQLPESGRDFKDPA
ncbi:cytochrome b/b6 domain-containing protein [Streptomyces luteolus]|uniref:Cytochrome b/b6 domain-containing protein n=1 Tax=Streptomyces luteolus TaxID=3043615 RepID=A0ABT6STJ1_9ACTN|nr:cytochrome b/b6 domain-containing protein [Streptomyces sp. B-S-A12]MDI3418918.1 cytochrome b/b6 domain-containing protein [Streptomyces sp. B-S-A12]